MLSQGGREGGEGGGFTRILWRSELLLSPEANSVKHLSYTVQNIKEQTMTSVLYTLLICRFPL